MTNSAQPVQESDVLVESDSSMNAIGWTLQGIVLGALSSFSAMALVLIFRSARIVNFAQVEIGGLAGGVSATCAVAFGLSFYISILIGISSAILAGLLIDAFVVRNLEKRSKLLLTIATIGIAELAGAGEVALPRVFHIRYSLRSYRFPLNFHFKAGGYIFNSNHLFAVLIAIASLLLLQVFVTKTSRGNALLACSEAPERAILLGIRTRATSSLVWVIAAVLSAVGAICAQPILGSSIGHTLGPASLLAPIAAAVIAGMKDLRFTFAVSIGIGILQQYILGHFHKSRDIVSVVLFVLIALAILIRSRMADPKDEVYTELEFERPIRRLRSDLRGYLPTRAFALCGLLVAIVLAVAIPTLLPRSGLIYMANLAIYSIIAVSLVVLIGWGGQINLGQFSLVGVGGALCAGLVYHYNLNLVLALITGAIVSGLIALILGIPSVRMPSYSFPIITLAFSVPVSLYLLAGSRVSWLTPALVRRPNPFGKLNLNSQLSFYYVCLGSLLLVAYLSYNFRVSRSGRNVLAVRDNPNVASAYGIDSSRTRMSIFAMSGLFAGLAGGLYVIGLDGVGAQTGGFDPQLSLSLLTMVAIGGSGSILGGLIGAVYLETVQYFLVGGWQLLAAGAGLLILVIMLPRGISGVLYATRDRILSHIEIKDRTRYRGTKPSGLASAAHELRSIEFADRTRSTSTSAAFPASGFSRMTYSHHPSTAPGGELLGCSNLRAAYGNTKVLDGVDLSLYPGEIVALVGPNGAGKSTMLRIFAGLMKPGKGIIRFRGRRLARFSAVQRCEQGLVTVLGGRSIFPSLSVRRNLDLATWLLREEPDAAKRGVNWVLSLFPALESRMQTPAGRLSGGEQQMLAIAQALLCRPRVLLIDEMSLGLSPITVHKLNEVLKELAGSGVGILLVEQSMNVATSICDRVVLLEHGAVVFNGPSPNLAARPDHLKSVFLNSAERAVGGQASTA
ncbi:MAG TPA: ATP-binding cassette domain-containing protein, partial [Acidimicrobiales bacterium]|nr:ATP-binding cassette domain-containing protein [Acidimicrobiales bacterium]